MERPIQTMRRTTQPLGHLSNARAAVALGDDFSLVVGQFFETLPEGVAACVQFAARDAHLDRRDLLGEFIGKLGRAAALLLAKAHHLVPRDAARPSGECRAAFKFVEFLPHHQTRLLKDLLRFFQVTNLRKDIAKQLPLNLFEQRGKFVSTIR